MAKVTRVLPGRIVRHEQIERPLRHEPKHGLLQLARLERRLSRAIVQVAHRSRGPQLAQGAPEAWGPVGVTCPAERHYIPIPGGMLEDRATSPQGLVIGVRNQDGGVAGRVSGIGVHARINEGRGPRASSVLARAGATRRTRIAGRWTAGNPRTASDGA